MNEKFSHSVLWKKGFRLNQRGEWYLPAHQAAVDLPHPVQEPNLRHEPAGPDARKKEGASGPLRVVITSYRVKLCDIDNLEPKFLIDALRYGGLIVNDSPQDITELALRQVKVAHFADEHTEVEITPV